jgi:hypothetical protein
MVRPAFTPRVKQRHNLVALSLSAGQVGAFANVAPLAREDEIVGVV